MTASARTPEQTHNAVCWQSAGGPALLWNGVARDLADDPAHALDIADSALLFAKMNLSGADAAINCWNDKYHFDFWRPWQAIHQADRDGNPATAPDPSWTALLTAPYPEHPSGHLCLDGAHLSVLQMFFGTDEMHFGVTSSQFDGETRHFDRFSQPLEEIIEARIWAGLHFRTADVQGRDLGMNVADYMADNYFQPAPCLTGPHHGPLTVSAGESICISVDATQTGPVTVRPGGSLDVEGGRITGPLTTTGAAAVRICGATITGPLTITGTTGPVLLGGAACAPNTIIGPVRVTANTGGVELSGNRIIGSLRVTGNSAPVHAAGNTVTGPVTIQN